MLFNNSERLNEKHADRVRFFLSKADTAGHESDRQVSCPSLLITCVKFPGFLESSEVGGSIVEVGSSIVEVGSYSVILH